MVEHPASNAPRPGRQHSAWLAKVSMPADCNRPPDASARRACASGLAWRLQMAGCCSHRLRPSVAVPTQHSELHPEAAGAELR